MPKRRQTGRSNHPHRATKPMQVVTEETPARDIRQGQILVLDGKLQDVLLVEHEGDTVRLYTAFVTKNPPQFDNWFHYKPLTVAGTELLDRACV